MNTALVEDSGTLLVGDNRLTKEEAKRLLVILRDKRVASHGKLGKVGQRIKILTRFIDETRGQDVTLRQWMHSIGLDYKNFYTSLGYYTPMQMVVSMDRENEPLIYHRDMSFNKEAGFHVPERRVVQTIDHNVVTHSQLGMTYNPQLAQYFPTTIYDTDLFVGADEQGDSAPDIMGGFSQKDLGKLTAEDAHSEEVVSYVLELFEEEFDNVDGELEQIEDLESYIRGWGNEEYANASGDKAFRNAMCRAKCNFKVKSKRPACWTDCDKQFPPSEKQEVRRDDRSNRITARKDKRSTIDDLKELLRTGQITKDEYTARLRGARQEKRDTVREDGGGSFFARSWRGFSKVFPITAIVRGGTLVLVKDNTFGFATRLVPALVPTSEAQQKFTPDAIAKAKIAWLKVSRSWLNAGGNPDKLKAAILSGYAKKPMKISKQASFDGHEYTYSHNFTGDDYSNFGGTAIATAVTAGVGLLTALVSVLKKSDVPLDPYQTGQSPSDYNQAINNGTLTDLPQPDPNSPQLDPVTGEWIDPSSGRAIDPATGEYADNILGMNKYLAIGLGVLIIGAIGFGIYKATGKSKAKGK